jgi:hypothetical protein
MPLEAHVLTQVERGVAVKTFLVWIVVFWVMTPCSRGERNNYFLKQFQQFQFQNITVTNNGYKITVCSTTWYDIYSVEIPSVTLLQYGDPVLFMFQTQSNSSLQVRKSTDMAQYIK